MERIKKVMKNTANQPLISIIVPAFNVETYISKCIDSILKQTYKNIELIIINDGSTDDTGEIIKKKSYEDDRIKVFNQMNSGVSSARNKGIETSSGKFILFVDPDDWIESDAVEHYLKLYNRHNDPDIVINGFIMEYEGDKSTLSIQVSEKTNVFYLEEFKEEFPRLLKKNFLATPWNKLYKKEVIIRNNIEFPNIKNEDLAFNFIYLLKCKKFSIGNNSDYHWLRNREGSETEIIHQKYEVDKLWENRKHITIMLNNFSDIFFDRDQKELIREVYSYIGDRIVQTIQETTDSVTFIEAYKIIKSVYRDELLMSAFDKSKPSKSMMKLMYIPIRIRSILLSILMGKIISFMKKRFSNLFNKIRARIVNG
ncbi:hypothetical protein IGI66_002315 [Enterococcus sp. AZ048]|uniref:glycosyltransferase family 2 protein n=1 Tax=Enterococcus sp. AZ048 TaxID=2774658 RepID=UPI003F2391AF